VIVEVWERQCDLGEEPSRELAMQFMKEQPAVGVYLAAQYENLGDEAEESQLIPLASAVWEAMSQTHGRRLKRVTPKVIDRAEARNIQMLEKLEEGSEFEQGQTVMKLFKGYHQQALLAFCLEILMANNEDSPELAPERIGMEFIFLKTLIDCFDQ
jgi:hypothetical protein